MKGRYLWSPIWLVLITGLSACSLVAGGSAEPEADPTAAAGYTIKVLPACDAEADTAVPALTLYDQNTNRLVGWSHINTSLQEFKNVQRATADYKIGATNSRPDETCNGQNTFQAILVKKLGDWDRQHANGIEPQFLHENITFGQVESIVLDLKINSQDTAVPTPAMLKETYGRYLTEEQLQAWDSGKVNLGITLFEVGFNNQSTPSFTGSTIVEIDQDIYADQWIRLTIPASSLTYYQEMNWEPTPALLTDFADDVILGLRINPETKTGAVVRNYIPDTFDSSIPELFKEMGLSISHISIVLKEG